MENPSSPAMKYHDPEDDTAALYAANTLAVGDADAFEQHLLICASCRNEVRLAALVRSELRIPSRRFNPWMLGGGLAIAAGFALIFTSTRTGSNSLAALGGVAAAPVYSGVTVRANTSATDSLFAQAMISYQQSNYSKSSEQFVAARAAGADSVTTTFFLGVSSLMSGNAVAAVKELQRASAMPQSAYTSESHYYLAKAFLRLRKRDDAMREIAMAAAGESTIQSAAKLLADSIKVSR